MKQFTDGGRQQIGRFEEFFKHIFELKSDHPRINPRLASLLWPSIRFVHWHIRVSRGFARQLVSSISIAPDDFEKPLGSSRQTCRLDETYLRRKESFAVVLPEAVESRVIIWNLSDLSVIAVTWGTIWIEKSSVLDQPQERSSVDSFCQALFGWRTIKSRDNHKLEKNTHTLCDTHLNQGWKAHWRYLLVTRVYRREMKIELKATFLFLSHSLSVSRYLCCD